MSRVWGEILGNAARALLVAGSLFGYVIHYFAFRGWYTEGRGDGWRDLGPGMSILFFSPLQLAAAVSLVRAYMNADLPDLAAPSLPSGGYGLDGIERRILRAGRTFRAGCWTLGLPAFAVGMCALAAFFGNPLPGASIVVGPVSVLWIPVWFAGLIAAFSASNQHDDSSLLFLALLYPVLSVVYTWL